MRIRHVFFISILPRSLVASLIGPKEYACGQQHTLASYSLSSFAKNNLSLAFLLDCYPTLVVQCADALHHLCRRTPHRLTARDYARATQLPRFLTRAITYMPSFHNVASCKPHAVPLFVRELPPNHQQLHPLRNRPKRRTPVQSLARSFIHLRYCVCTPYLRPLQLNTFKCVSLLRMHPLETLPCVEAWSLVSPDAH